jgi:hypothetical protein
MKTHNGDINKVISDIGKITFDTLEKYNIPYDELIFGKPYAHFYIDDLAINCFNNLEKELGFYETLVSPRDFHNIETTLDTITKRGQNLWNEIEWYLNMPKSIKDIFPIMIKYDPEGKWYEMERIHGLTISKIYLEEELTKETLLSILGTLERIHSSKSDLKNDDISIYSNYQNKLNNRYLNYDYSKFPDHKLYYDFIYYELTEYESKDLGKKSIIHGDPVFTNILINCYGKVKMIDVRGKLMNNNSLYGDCFYDYAKIYQSLIGYDEILLDKKVDMKYKNDLIHVFEEYIASKFGKDRIKWVKIITMSLLFTLIPLHSDINKNKKYYELLIKIYKSF